MTTTQSRVNRFIQHFGQSINAHLSLKNGVCALYDLDNQESAIIEVPEGSESAIFHCTLIKLDNDVSVDVLRQLLLLNFEISAMQGCWLAVDEENQICLCYTLNISQADEQSFSDTLTGFIEQAKDVRSFIVSHLLAKQSH